MEGMRNVEERVGNDTFHARNMPNWLDTSIYEAQTPPRHRNTILPAAPTPIPRTVRSRPRVRDIISVEDLSHI